MTGDAERASVTVQDRVEWVDTDASGHQHHSALLRWVEAAEAELLRRHDLATLFGRTPRVHQEVDHRARLWFGDRVATTLTVTHVGGSSMRYDFVVRRGDGVVAADGHLVIVHARPDDEGAEPWPDQVRARLLGAPAVGETAR